MDFCMRYQNQSTRSKYSFWIKGAIYDDYLTKRIISKEVIAIIF
jgi:hypothetical protein